MTEQSTKTETIDTWAIIELMGHQRMAGRVSEATIAGGAFIRVDVPECIGAQGLPDAPAYTRFLNPSAIYAINPTDEATATHAAKAFRPQPVSRWELPALPAAEQSDTPDW